MFPIQPSRWW